MKHIIKAAQARMTKAAGELPEPMSPVKDEVTPKFNDIALPEDGVKVEHAAGRKQKSPNFNYGEKKDEKQPEVERKTASKKKKKSPNFKYGTQSAVDDVHVEHAGGPGSGPHKKGANKDPDEADENGDYFAPRKKKKGRSTTPSPFVRQAGDKKGGTVKLSDKAPKKKKRMVGSAVDGVDSTDPKGDEANDTDLKGVPTQEGVQLPTDLTPILDQAQARLAKASVKVTATVFNDDEVKKMKADMKAFGFSVNANDSKPSRHANPNRFSSALEFVQKGTFYALILEGYQDGDKVKTELYAQCQSYYKVSGLEQSPTGGPDSYSNESSGSMLKVLQGQAQALKQAAEDVDNLAQAYKYLSKYVGTKKVPLVPREE